MVGTEDLQAELSQGGHEVSDERTLAIGTTLDMARQAARAAGVGAEAADTEARRLGIDHALKQGLARHVVWVKRNCDYKRQDAEAKRMEERGQCKWQRAATRRYVASGHKSFGV